jgi:O-antigen ligase
MALRTSFASRNKWYAALAVLLIGLIAPNSRNALIGVVIGLLLFDFYRRKWGPLFAKLSIGAIGYLLLLTAAQFWPYAANLVGKSDETHSSNEYRLLLLRRGMEEISKHPILGTTMKEALQNLQDIQQGQHIIDLVNGYVTYGLTLGYLGMVGLLVVFVSLCLAMLGARRQLSPNRELRDIAAFTFAVSGFMILVAAFTSFGGEGSTYFYLVASLGSSVWALRKAARLAGPEIGGQAGLVHTSAIREVILRDREAARSAPAPSAVAPAQAS